MLADPGGGGGNRFFTIGFIYFTARMIKECEWLNASKKLLNLAVLIFVMGSVLSFVLAMLKFGALTPIRVVEFHAYNAPYVWFLGIVIVCFAVQVKLPRRIETIGGFLAPSMFGVFLLHDCVTFGYETYRIPQRVLGNLWPECSHVILILMSAVISFCGVLIIDLLRRALLTIISEGYKLLH